MSQSVQLSNLLKFEKLKSDLENSSEREGRRMSDEEDDDMDMLDEREHEDEEDEEEDEEDMAAAALGVAQQVVTEAQVPDSVDSNALRACIPCLLVKTYVQFFDHGCENCPFLNMRDDKEILNGSVTRNFEGLISITDVNQSWVAKWQLIKYKNYLPGCYAVKVHDDVSPAVNEVLEMKNITNLGEFLKDKN